MRVALRALPMLVGLLLAACAEPLDAPSAYDDQVYVCGESAAAARDAQSETCRRTHDCAGWVSLRGTLQGQPVTVGSPLRRVTLDATSVPDVGFVRDSVELSAASPYFSLRLIFSDLPPQRITEGELELPIGLAEDDLVRASLRLQGGGASVELPGRDGLLRTSWTLDEQTGEAHLDFASDDAIDACFFARTSVEGDR
jgi:hypothetical protein